MKDFKKNVGERLKEARLKKDLKQNRVAKHLGIHNSTLAKYESGEREADYETLNKLADLYDIKLDELAGANTKAESIKLIMDSAGEPGSSERETVSNIIVSEIEKLPKHLQDSLLQIIRHLQK